MLCTDDGIKSKKLLKIYFKYLVFIYKLFDGKFICSENISGFSMSTISWFKSIENKQDVFKGKDCMENFW